MIRYCLTEHSDCNGKYVNEEYNYSEECFCSCHKTKEGLGPGLRNQAQPTAEPLSEVNQINSYIRE